MSQFAVDVRTVESVSPHPNADRLELATVDGLLYQMVVGKGEFTVGDPAIYFPLDAVLPEQLRMTLGLPRNRIKTVKLRGQISQGVLVPLHKLPALVPSGADLAGALGVTKYEPEECVGQGGARMTTLPAGLSVYDIENAERHKADWAALLASPHVVTEKLEGTNFCAHIDEDGVFRVCSRRHTVEEGVRRVIDLLILARIAARFRTLQRDQHALSADGDRSRVSAFLNRHHVEASPEDDRRIGDDRASRLIQEREPHRHGAILIILSEGDGDQCRVDAGKRRRHVVCLKLLRLLDAGKTEDVPAADIAVSAP